MTTPNRTYAKVFTHNPELLEEMLALKLQGWSANALGIKYGVDHTSILYQCAKAGIPTTTGYIKRIEGLKRPVVRVVVRDTMPPRVIPAPSKSEPFYFEERVAGFPQRGVEKINKGHDYSYYLSKDRFKKLTATKAGKTVYAQRNINIGEGQRVASPAQY